MNVQEAQLSYFFLLYPPAPPDRSLSPWSANCRHIFLAEFSGRGWWFGKHIGHFSWSSNFSSIYNTLMLTRVLHRIALQQQKHHSHNGREDGVAEWGLREIWDKDREKLLMTLEHWLLLQSPRPFRCLFMASTARFNRCRPRPCDSLGISFSRNDGE